MAENPLLPNAELRALHHLLRTAARAEAEELRRRARSGAKSARNTQPGSRAALLAGMLLQLKSGDVAVPEPEDALAASLLHEETDGRETGTALAVPASAPRLMIAAGLAAAHQASGEERLVLALVRAGTRPADWPAALTWAQERQLPLVLAVADPSGPNAFGAASGAGKAGDFTWPAVQKLTAKLKLPVLSVDGEDAVAVYRVMQESALRARSGGGPAILWAMLPSAQQLAAQRPRTALPVARLERYLKARGIALS